MLVGRVGRLTVRLTVFIFRNLIFLSLLRAGASRACWASYSTLNGFHSSVVIFLCLLRAGARCVSFGLTQRISFFSGDFSLSSPGGC